MCCRSQCDNDTSNGNNNKMAPEIASIQFTYSPQIKIGFSALGNAKWDNNFSFSFNFFLFFRFFCALLNCLNVKMTSVEKMDKNLREYIDSTALVGSPLWVTKWIHAGNETSKPYQSPFTLSDLTILHYKIAVAVLANVRRPNKKEKPNHNFILVYSHTLTPIQCLLTVVHMQGNME